MDHSQTLDFSVSSVTWNVFLSYTVCIKKIIAICSFFRSSGSLFKNTLKRIFEWYNYFCLSRCNLYRKSLWNNIHILNMYIWKKVVSRILEMLTLLYEYLKFLNLRISKEILNMFYTSYTNKVALVLKLT